MTNTRLPFTIDALRKALFSKAAESSKVAEAAPKQNESIQQVFQNGAFKTSTVSLGADSRVGSKPALVPPTITSGEIKLDGIFNPYTIVNFQIARDSLGANKIIAFKVYRKETTATALGQIAATYNKSDFDQISNNSTRTGKFSQERKAQYVINPSAQAQSAINQNLFDLQQTGNAQAASNGQGATSQYSQQNLKASSDDYTLVATIKYADAQAQAQLKQVYVANDAVVNSYYEDHMVSYGTSYTYAVTAYCKTGEESARSSTISMQVLNLDGIGQPVTFAVRQVDETSMQVAASFDIKDKIKRAHIFKRDVQETRFEKIAVVDNANNSVNYTDKDVTYLASYIYRIILENIFGAVSEPQEITATCSTQRAIDKSRSVNMLFPIFLTSQDPYSDGNKITIYPNDPRVLYYQLDRINLTTHEKRFSVPRNKTTEYWPQNKFFVTNVTGSLINSGTLAAIASGSLPAQTAFASQATPITFVDRFVIVNNVYKYRVTGFDKAGNSTASVFSTIGSLAKNALRAPVNLAYDVLREQPLRIKLRWDDDNDTQLGANDIAAEQQLLDLNLQSANLSAEQQRSIEALVTRPDVAKIDLNAALLKYNLRKEQLAAIQTQVAALSQINTPLRYQLQRREDNSPNFSSWPLTQNEFVYDEVVCADPVKFEAFLVDASYTPISSSSALTQSVSQTRPYGLPSYMQYDKNFEYRVAAIASDGAASAYSPSIFVSSATTLPVPANLSASALNPKVTPCVTVLTWTVNPSAPVPDHFRIERREKTATDPFQVIGNAYLKNEYLDRGTFLGKTYEYRIRSVSAKNLESATATVTMST